MGAGQVWVNWPHCCGSWWALYLIIALAGGKKRFERRAKADNIEQAGGEEAFQNHHHGILATQQRNMREWGKKSVRKKVKTEWWGYKGRPEEDRAEEDRGGPEKRSGKRPSLCCNTKEIHSPFLLLNLLSFAGHFIRNTYLTGTRTQPVNQNWATRSGGLLLETAK